MSRLNEFINSWASEWSSTIAGGYVAAKVFWRLLLGGNVNGADIGLLTPDKFSLEFDLLNIIDSDYLVTFFLLL